MSPEKVIDIGKNFMGSKATQNNNNDDIKFVMANNNIDSIKSGYLVDVFWGQPIKLIQVASTSELLENQQNDLVFFKIIPSHFCRVSET